MPGKWVVVVSVSREYWDDGVEKVVGPFDYESAARDYLDNEEGGPEYGEVFELKGADDADE